MVTEQSRELRGAIENLVTAKLLDILSRPDRVSRLNAQRLRAAGSEPIPQPRSSNSIRHCPARWWNLAGSDAAT